MVLKNGSAKRRYEFKYSGLIINMDFNYTSGDDYAIVKIYDNHKTQFDEHRVNFKVARRIDLAFGFVDKDIYSYLRGLKKSNFRGKDHYELLKALEYARKKYSGVHISQNLEDRL